MCHGYLAELIILWRPGFKAHPCLPHSAVVGRIRVALEVNPCISNCVVAYVEHEDVLVKRAGEM